MDTLDKIENGKTVDAAIIGSVFKNGVNVNVIASGSCANEFADLKNYGMNITVVGSVNGQASGIKLLRSSTLKEFLPYFLSLSILATKWGLIKKFLNIFLKRSVLIL